MKSGWEHANESTNRITLADYKQKQATSVNSLVVNEIGKPNYIVVV